MSTVVEQCERCGASIPTRSYNQNRPFQFYRVQGQREYESAEVRLCSMCLDDVWEFVLEESPDRSDKADPVALGKMADSVSSHIDDLQGVLEQLEGVKT